ncbi:hypothetical protein WG922_02475 [Ramlibacter sp. AN1015]|uniref:hypothetical protein n=1 Tax=Ramlibacter sp. AN1015 TaxID=3133428 RepID=UPI0030C2DDCD
MAERLAYRAGGGVPAPQPVPPATDQPIEPNQTPSPPPPPQVPPTEGDTPPPPPVQLPGQPHAPERVREE